MQLYALQKNIVVHFALFIVWYMYIIHHEFSEKEIEHNDCQY